MKLLQDKHIRYFCRFLMGFILLLLATGFYFFSQQQQQTKQLLLWRENTLASSLLEQGVPEETIAIAIANSQSSESGKDYLAKIGRKETVSVSTLPELAEFHKKSSKAFCFTAIFLSALLISGVFVFLWSQEKLYRQAGNIVQSYLDGDFSHRLAQNGEGPVYRLFSAMDELATMLQARGETRQKEKNFLKQTISDISHQLKTPLSALSMYQEILAAEPEQPDIVKAFSTKMAVSLDRLKQLIEAMLKITRLDAGSIVFEQKSYKVSEVISRGLNQLETRANLENKEIIIEGNEHQSLCCDLEWTGEAIGNIVKNALDHTKAGGIIYIAWTASPNMTRIRITDNGSGIAPEDLHHVFKRFYRSKGALDTQGVGLGLPLAKAIVEGQRGIISVKSELGMGTAFTLSFLTEL